MPPVLALLVACADVEGLLLLPADVGRFTVLGPWEAGVPLRGEELEPLLTPPTRPPCLVVISSWELGVLAGVLCGSV